MLQNTGRQNAQRHGYRVTARCLEMSNAQPAGAPEGRRCRAARKQRRLRAQKARQSFDTGYLQHKQKHQSRRKVWRMGRANGLVALIAMLRAQRGLLHFCRHTGVGARNSRHVVHVRLLDGCRRTQLRAYICGHRQLGKNESHKCDPRDKGAAKCFHGIGALCDAPICRLYPIGIVNYCLTEMRNRRIMTH